MHATQIILAATRAAVAAFMAIHVKALRFAVSLADANAKRSTETRAMARKMLEEAKAFVEETKAGETAAYKAALNLRTAANAEIANFGSGQRV